MKSRLCLGCVVLVLLACGPKAPPESSGVVLPEFVTSPVAGCGVGSFLVTTDIQMAMEQADANARVALAASVEAEVERVVVQAREQLELSGKAENLTYATTGLRETVAGAMVGTVPSRREQVGDQLWSEVCLDLDTFNDIVGGMTDLSPSVQDFLRDRGMEIIENLGRPLEDKR